MRSYRTEELFDGNGRLVPALAALTPKGERRMSANPHTNLIVIDKQPQLQWLDMDAAVKHCTAGASVCHWASND